MAAIARIASNAGAGLTVRVMRAVGVAVREAVGVGSTETLDGTIMVRLCIASGDPEETAAILML